MRRVNSSVVGSTHQLDQGEFDENENLHNGENNNRLSVQGMPSSRSFSTIRTDRPHNNNASEAGMTSRPSFISLMLIASDDNLNRMPRLPAPLQVESDTYQRCGWEDEPKICSQLPVLHPPSDCEDESEPHEGILQSIIHLPDIIRKISDDKQRFNVFALPDQERGQLKNLYVY